MQCPFECFFYFNKTRAFTYIYIFFFFEGACFGASVEFDEDGICLFVFEKNIIRYRIPPLVLEEKARLRILLVWFL